MEEHLLASEILGKCGVLWCQLDVDIETFHVNLVTTTYGDGAIAAVKAECWMEVPTTFHGIWYDLRKVRV